VFEHPGSGFDSTSRLYRELIAAFAGGPNRIEPSSGPVEEGVPSRRRTGVDIFSLARFCAQVELASFTGQRDLAREPYELLVFAAERGVVFSSGWIFLVPRMLGLASSLAGAWDRAEAHFATAVEIAIEQGARPELARTYLDDARMRLARNARGDRDLVIERIGTAQAIFEELGMVPFTRQCAELASDLGLELPSAAAPLLADELSPQEVELLVHVARGHGPREIADELLQTPRTVADRTRELMQKVSAQDPVSLANYAVERGYLPSHRARATREAMPWVEGATPAGARVICFTDLERSTELIQKLGDQQARALMRVHDEAVRRCVRIHKGEEIQHTGDGFMLSFASAGAAIGCAKDVQAAVGEINRNAPSPLRVRIGMTAGEPIADHGGLFGTAVNAAARICNRAHPGEILVSHVVRELAQGADFAFKTRGRVKLKGFPERFSLFEVQWEGGRAVESHSSS
jgi:class 3 adenylate cyclase